MKHLKIILTITTIFFLSGCTNYLKTDKITNTGGTTKVNQQNENLKFDIDLESLSYNLPIYTKICIPETKQYCISDGKCEKMKAEVFVLYNENNNMIYRCDNNPCDGFEVEVRDSGVFSNLSPVEPNGALYKISLDNKYVETVSLALDTYISHGSCK